VNPAAVVKHEVEGKRHLALLPRKSAKQAEFLRKNTSHKS
jgi:hypothetical protein